VLVEEPGVLAAATDDDGDDDDDDDNGTYCYRPLHCHAAVIHRGSKEAMSLF